MSCRKSLQATAIATFLMMFGGVAHAQSAQVNQWSAQVKEPDVFGDKTVIAAIANNLEQALVIQCSNSEPIELAVLEQHTQEELNELSKMGGSYPIAHSSPHFGIRERSAEGSCL